MIKPDQQASREAAMTRISALAVAAIAAASFTAASMPKAEAGYFPWGAVAAGAVVGGIAVGIAASQARARPAYIVDGPVCSRRTVWVDTAYGPMRRAVQVCH